jgi:hypothetical protein
MTFDSSFNQSNSNRVCLAGQNVVRKAQLLDSLNNAAELKVAQQCLRKGGFQGESRENRVKRGIHAGFREQLASTATSRLKEQCGVAPQYGSTVLRYIGDGDWNTVARQLDMTWPNHNRDGQCYPHSTLKKTKKAVYALPTLSRHYGFDMIYTKRGQSCKTTYHIPHYDENVINNLIKNGHNY